MDGADLFAAPTPRASGPSAHPALRALPPWTDRAPETALPTLQEEVDAIIAAAPRACRANASWAVPLLMTTARAGGITHLRRIAYVLATAQYGSQFGAQLVEPDNVGGYRCPFERFEPETPQGRALGNTHAGDGERFRGRGFVPVRGRTAYTLWSHRLGLADEVVDGVAVPYFVAHPSVMAQPNIAAQTLVRGMRDGLFTGIALGSHVNDKKTDFWRARRVIDDARHAREIAEIAESFALAIEQVQTERNWAELQHRARMSGNQSRDIMQDVRDAIGRLAMRGEHLPPPLEVVEWNGEARQGKFVMLDERSCALHLGRGTYVRLDIQRDLNGVAPPEGRNVALKRSGEVRVATRHGETHFWR